MSSEQFPTGRAVKAAIRGGQGRMVRGTLADEAVSRKGSKSRPLTTHLIRSRFLSHEPYVCERANSMREIVVGHPSESVELAYCERRFFDDGECRFQGLSPRGRLPPSPCSSQPIFAADKW